MEFQERYEFDPKTDLLGKGGFSKVYMATDTLLERTVALKFFTGTISDKYQILNEIKKVIRFEHPNLCKYYDVAELSNKNVLGETERIEVGIMEYIDGGDLKSYTRKNPQHIDKLFIDVLKGLAYLHRHGIAHRDLKPQNILVKTDEDEPISKITDFGISKVIASDDGSSSTLLGTIEYMAPEQFNPKKYGINSRITTNLDLWSFGLLVYEAVCHESFFGSRSGGISAEQVMANILSDASLFKVDTMPAKYREIVKRCLVKNAAERVQSALELIPLFERKVVPEDEIPISREPEPAEASGEVKQVIETGSPVNETTQDGSITQEMPSRETDIVFAAPEPSSQIKQVIQPEPGEPGDETQAIGQTGDETQAIEQPTEETQVIEPVAESSPIDTGIIESQLLPTEEIIRENKPVTDIKSNEKKFLVNEDPGQQPAKSYRETKARPVSKMIIFSLVAVLLIILFIAFPFLTRKNEPAKKEPVDTIASAPPAVQAEDWIPELIQVNEGTFIMGDIYNNAPNSTNKAHKVALRGFSLGKYEITIAQFKKFIDETQYITTAQQKGASEVLEENKWVDSTGIDWRFDVRGNLVDNNTKNIPVVHVSWADANAYCMWLSGKTNETFRLLTEAEWEFAARGGNNTKHFTYSGSDSLGQVAWYKENSNDSIHPVGLKQPNELGIYDMSGNALEWCYDWYDKDYYNKSPMENPAGPDSPARDSVKVVRGGAWAYGKNVSSNVERRKLKADVIGGSTGFRICREKK